MNANQEAFAAEFPDDDLIAREQALFRGTPSSFLCAADAPKVSS
jgi:hypothetical protein